MEQGHFPLHIFIDFVILSSKPRTMADTKKHPRILLVDDEASVLKALSRALRPHQVFLAKDYYEALTVLQREPLDVVISDCSMVGPSGVEVLRAAQRLQPGARRIMLSGNPPEDLERLVEEETLQRFILKPWKGEEIRQLVESEADW